MKTGTDLQLLAKEIERRQTAKRDFIAPVERITMIGGQQLALAGKENETFVINPVAHNQLIEFTKIPGDYYRTLLREDPELLTTNVNKRLVKQPEKRRMVRTLDGKCRAFLSDGYRSLENEDLADAVLPVLMDLNLLILSSEITDTRFYIKAVDKSILKDVPTGAKLGEGHVRFDTISPAITISNSEVGYGALAIESGVYTDWCTNLASFGAVMRKYHTGSRAELSDEVYALLTDDTKKLTDAAVWAQARDMVRAAFNAAKFDEIVKRLGDAAEQRLEGDVVEIVHNVAKRYTLSENERSGILSRLVEGGDLTRYGLHAAVTRHSADVVDYDRATAMEKLGGTLIELPKSEWNALTKTVLAKAA